MENHWPLEITRSQWVTPNIAEVAAKIGDPRTFVAHESGAKRCVGRPSSTGATTKNGWPVFTKKSY